MAVERRPKLSVAEQIQHMKSKGIQFNIEDENFAKKYLTDNTYYFKLKAYEKLYTQLPLGENKGKYLNLEFAYLRDLATIDSLLRKRILSIAIDIEHYLKVALLRDFNNSPEDGYGIIEEFISNNKEHFENEFEMNSNGKTCGDLVQKYNGNFAIWNFIEVISFKDFADLYSFFYIRNANIFCKRRNKEKFRGEYYYLINPVRILRNAAAHNNCLLINLNKVPKLSFNFEHKVSKFLGDRKIKNTSLNKQLSKPLVHDFCVMLYLYSQVAPTSAQKHTFEELKELFLGRFIKNKEYHSNNYLISSSYEFVVKVIDIFCKELES